MIMVMAMDRVATVTTLLRSPAQNAVRRKVQQLDHCMIGETPGRLYSRVLLRQGVWQVHDNTPERRNRSAAAEQEVQCQSRTDLKPPALSCAWLEVKCTWFMYT